MNILFLVVVIFVQGRIQVEATSQIQFNYLPSQSSIASGGDGRIIWLPQQTREGSIIDTDLRIDLSGLPFDNLTLICVADESPNDGCSAFNIKAIYTQATPTTQTYTIKLIAGRLAAEAPSGTDFGLKLLATIESKNQLATEDMLIVKIIDQSITSPESIIEPADFDVHKINEEVFNFGHSEAGSGHSGTTKVGRFNFRHLNFGHLSTILPSTLLSEINAGDASEANLNLDVLSTSIGNGWSTRKSTSEPESSVTDAGATTVFAPADPDPFGEGASSSGVSAFATASNFGFETSTSFLEPSDFGVESTSAPQIDSKPTVGTSFGSSIRPGFSSSSSLSPSFSPSLSPSSSSTLSSGLSPSSKSTTEPTTEVFVESIAENADEENSTDSAESIDETSLTDSVSVTQPVYVPISSTFSTAKPGGISNLPSLNNFPYSSTFPPLPEAKLFSTPAEDPFDKVVDQSTSTPSLILDASTFLLNIASTTPSIIVDYEPGVTSETRKPEEVNIDTLTESSVAPTLPTARPRLHIQPPKAPTVVHKTKIVFQPDQPQVIRFREADLQKGFPLPGFQVKIMSTQQNRVAYKISLSDAQLNNYLTVAPSQAKGQTLVYLRVQDPTGLVSVIGANSDGAQIKFQVIAKPEDGSQEITLDVTLIREGSSMINGDDLIFAKERYEFLLPTEVGSATEVGSVMIDTHLNRSGLAYQLYGDQSDLFSVKLDGRIELQCSSGNDCSTTLALKKRFDLLCVAVENKIRSYPVEVVIKVKSNDNATSDEQSDAKFRCIPDRLHLVNGEMTRPAICETKDPYGPADDSSLSLRVDTDTLRPYFSFRNLPGPKGGALRWISVLNSNPNAGNYSLQISLLKRSSVIATFPIALVVEDNTKTLTRFFQNPYSINLFSRDLKPGRILTKLSILHPTTTQSTGPVAFYITNGGQSGLLQLNETTGDLTLSKNFDLIKRWREKNFDDHSTNLVTAYEVVALNADSGLRLCSSTILLNLTENTSGDDAEDEAIEFDRSLFSGQLPSDAQVGTVALKLLLASSSHKTRARYAMVPHSTMILDKTKRLVLRTKNPFEIQPDGMVVLGSPLPTDRDLSSILFRVEARPLNSSHNADSIASAIVAVYVTPARRPPPNARAQFLPPWSANETVLNIQLPETAPVGYVVAVLPAIDPANAEVALAAQLNERASLERRKWLDHFRYNSESGILRLAKQIDFESLALNDNPIVLELLAGGDAKNGSVAILNITVMDENDSPPVFTQKVHIVRLSEDAPTGHVVLSVEFLDNDTVGNNFAFTLEGGNGYFQLRRSSKDENRVNIVVAPLARLDYELGDRLYSLAITIRDGANQEDTTSVFIYIDDSNDHAPRFLKTDYSAQVPENFAIGSTLFKVGAIDEDSGENAMIAYELSASEGSDLFSIDSQNGEVKVVQTLAHHARPEPYVLHITAADRGKPTPKASGVIGHVYILEASAALANAGDNEQEGNVKLLFIQPPLGFVLKVAENQEKGILLYNVQAIDIRTQRQGQKPASTFGGVFYSIAPKGDYESFVLDPYSGELRTTQMFDYERQKEYSIVLVARSAVDDPSFSSNTTSTGLTQVSRLLSIRVEDVDDNLPMFDRTQDSIPVVFTVPEHSERGYALGYVRATDSDASSQFAKIRYHITCGNEHGLFEIDSSNGSITLSKSLPPIDIFNTSNSARDMIAYEFCVLVTPWQSTPGAGQSQNDTNDDLVTLAPVAHSRVVPYDSKNLSMIRVLVKVELEIVIAEIDFGSKNLTRTSLGMAAIADRQQTLEMEKLKSMPQAITHKMSGVYFTAFGKAENSIKNMENFSVGADTGTLSVNPSLYTGPEGVYKVVIDLYTTDDEQYYDTLVHYVNVVRDANKLKFIFDIPLASLESKWTQSVRDLKEAVGRVSGNTMDIVLDSPIVYENNKRRSALCFHAIQNNTDIMDRLETLKKMEQMAQALLPTYQDTNIVDIQDCAAAIETASLKPVEMVLFVFAGSLALLAMLAGAVYYVVVKKYNSLIPKKEEKVEPSEPATSESSSSQSEINNEGGSEKYEWKEQSIADFR